MASAGDRIEDMAYTISRPGMSTVSVESAEEAAELLHLLEMKDRQRDQDEGVRRAWDRASAKIGLQDVEAFVVEQFSSPWTPSQFHAFVGSLAGSSRKLLSLLTKVGTASDQELRVVADVGSNQALAGVLSAISKRAAALGIKAKDVFTVTNHRSGGTRRNDYTIAPMFKEAAAEMNWTAMVDAEED